MKHPRLANRRLSMRVGGGGMQARKGRRRTLPSQKDAQKGAPQNGSPRFSVMEPRWTRAPMLQGLVRAEGPTCDSGIAQARRLNDEYVLGKKLGTGSYAVVREATCKRNNRVFAVKIIDRKQAKEHRLKSEVWRPPSRLRGVLFGLTKSYFTQVALMGTVDHPNCVRLWDVFQDKDTLSLVLDLLTGGTVSLRHGVAPPSAWALFVAFKQWKTSWPTPTVFTRE